MQRFISILRNAIGPVGLAIAFALATASSANAGGVACACDVLLSRLNPAEIPATLKVPDPSGEILAAGDNGKRPITAIAFLKYGKIMAVAESGPARKGKGPAGRVRLYDLSGKSPRLVETLDVTTDYVAALAANPSGPNVLVAASVRWDQRLQTWTHADKKWSRTFATGRFSDWWIKSAVISPDGKTLATGAEGVRLWSLKDGQLRHEQTLPGNSWAVSAIAFSPDGKRLVAGTGSGHLDPKDGQLLVWSLGKSPKEIARAAVAKGDVTGVVIGRDGRIVTADQTGKLVFWSHGKSGELIRGRDIHAHERGVRSLHAVLGGRLISTGNDGTVAVWHGETGRIVKRWTFHAGAAIATVAPSGRHVAVGLSDGRVYVLRLANL